MDTGDNKSLTNDSILDIAAVEYLTPANAKFAVHDDFVGLEYTDKEENVHTYERINLHRDFPFEYVSEFISVLDMEQAEIGIIRNLDLFDEKEREILWNELSRKYYVREIRAITLVKERPGYSYWKVDTDAGEMTFTLKDTFKSIFKITSKRLVIQDVDANRFEIKDISALDKKSFKKIEIYI